MQLQYIPDHIERALANLTSQFQRSPNIKAIVRASVWRVQEIEDAAWSTLMDRTLSSAQGASLEQYGRIVGVARGGLDDDAYRTMIHARILGNRASGAVARLIEVWRLLNASAPVSVREHYPNTLIFSVDQPHPTTPEQRLLTRQWMRQIKKAGVAIELVESPHAGGFGFVGSADSLGFNQGIFAGVI